MYCYLGCVCFVFFVSFFFLSFGVFFLSASPKRKFSCFEIVILSANVLIEGDGKIIWKNKLKKKIIKKPDLK